MQAGYDRKPAGRLRPHIPSSIEEEEKSSSSNVDSVDDSSIAGDASWHEASSVGNNETVTIAGSNAGSNESIAGEGRNAEKRGKNDISTWVLQYNG